MTDSKNKPRILTPHDLAFGIGRVATDEEWEIYFSSCDNEAEGVSAEDFKKEIKKTLEAHRKNKKIVA
jgi:hypothetical protein